MFRFFRLCSLRVDSIILLVHKYSWFCGSLLSIFSKMLVLTLTWCLLATLATCEPQQTCDYSEPSHQDICLNLIGIIAESDGIHLLVTYNQSNSYNVYKASFTEDLKMRMLDNGTASSLQDVFPDLYNKPKFRNYMSSRLNAINNFYFKSPSESELRRVIVLESRDKPNKLAFYNASNGKSIIFYEIMDYEFCISHSPGAPKYCFLGDAFHPKDDDSSYLSELYFDKNGEECKNYLLPYKFGLSSHQHMVTLFFNASDNQNYRPIQCGGVFKHVVQFNATAITNQGRGYASDKYVKKYRLDEFLLLPWKNVASSGVLWLVPVAVLLVFITLFVFIAFLISCRCLSPRKRPLHRPTLMSISKLSSSLLSTSNLRSTSTSTSKFPTSSTSTLRTASTTKSTFRHPIKKR